MAEKKAMHDEKESSDEVFEALDFVYAGQRLSADGKPLMCVIPIRNDVLQSASFYSYERKLRWAIGGVYQGTKFSARQARGLANATYVRRWGNQADVIDWQSRNDQAETSQRTKKMESDARKTNDIERIMLPLRQQYETYRRQRDHGGLEALRDAVLRALRAAPTVAESQEKQ